MMAFAQPGQIDYVVGRMIFERKGEVGLMLEKDFFEACGLSRSSFQRYLRKLGIPSFVSFRNLLLVDFKEVEHFLKEKECARQKQNRQLPISIEKIRNIYVFPDEPSLGLLIIYLPYLCFKNPNIRIMQNLVPDAAFFSECSIQKQDLLLFTTLFHTYYDLMFRSRFSRNKNLNLKDANCLKAFIGFKGEYEPEEVDAFYINSQDSICKQAETFMTLIEPE